MLLVGLLVGSGISIYRKYHTDFPVRMIFRETVVEFKESKRAGLAWDGQDNATSTVPAGKINLNTAGLMELDSLPYIGPTLSRRILQYRQKNGRFQEVDDLLKIKGIGKKTLEKIRGCLEAK